MSEERQRFQTVKEWRKSNLTELYNAKVETSFKLKYHGDDLDKSINRSTTKKHNELVSLLCAIIQDLESRIDYLERQLQSKENI